MSKEECLYIFKFVLVGDIAVGKSCFLSQYINEQFKDEYEQTIGAEFESKVVDILEDVKVQIQSWDTVSQLLKPTLFLIQGRGPLISCNSEEILQKVYFLRLILISSTAGIFIYDMTRKETYQTIRTLFSDFKKETSDKMLSVLVATKLDMTNQSRQVSKEEGQQLAQELNAKFYELNLREKQPINQIYNELAQEILKLIKTNQIDPSNEAYGIKIQSQEKKDKKGKLHSSKLDQVQSESSTSHRLVIFAIPILIAALLYYFFVSR